MNFQDDHYNVGLPVHKLLTNLADTTESIATDIKQTAAIIFNSTDVGCNI